MKIICYGLSNLCKEFLSRDKYHVDYVVDKNATTQGEYFVGGGVKGYTGIPSGKIERGGG